MYGKSTQIRFSCRWSILEIFIINSFSFFSFWIKISESLTPVHFFWIFRIGCSLCKVVVYFFSEKMSVNSCFSPSEISCKRIREKYPPQTYHQFFKKQRIFQNNYSDARCLNPLSGEVLSFHSHTCLAEKWFIFREKLPDVFFRIYAAERDYSPIWFLYERKLNQK